MQSWNKKITLFTSGTDGVGWKTTFDLAKKRYVIVVNGLNERPDLKLQLRINPPNTFL